MNDLIAHRGPDDEGLHAAGYMGFGNRRLAIVDLTSAGHQPMSTDDGRLWITYNGEIYNFPELRTDLEARGHRFRSHTDTEVILTAYREFGVDCLVRLRGMFAFAIWDAENERLFIARDRVGKKPLHYWVDADGIAFASEPKAFLADPGFVPRPDLAAISLYLTYQYVPSPASVMAKRFGTDHHEFVVRPDAVEIIPELVWHYNEPYADSSAIPSYYLARLTREHVTVALNGDGGDENFAGYDRYVANLAAARVDRIPRGLRVVAARAVGLVGRGRNPKGILSR